MFHVNPEPPPLGYPDFAQYVRLEGITPEQLFIMASECFGQVRAQVKQLQVGRLHKCLLLLATSTSSTAFLTLIFRRLDDKWKPMLH